jgi:hypothetical protein
MKKTGKKSLIKKKSLFDHINQIKKVQNPKYWETLTEEDKKSWSNYMIHRFLSMNMNIIDLVNELQNYTSYTRISYLKIIDFINMLKGEVKWHIQIG